MVILKYAPALTLHALALATLPHCLAELWRDITAVSHYFGLCVWRRFSSHQVQADRVGET